MIGRAFGLGGNSTVFFLGVGGASVVVEKWRCGLFQTRNYLELSDGDIVVVSGPSTGSGWLCGERVDVVVSARP